MTKSEIKTKIKKIQTELENRYNHGMVKMADSAGVPIDTVVLQNELFSLIYKLSKLD